MFNVTHSISIQLKQLNCLRDKKANCGSLVLSLFTVYKERTIKSLHKEADELFQIIVIRPTNILTDLQIIVITLSNYRISIMICANIN